MRTPPSTRTKDDANKELHEIELKINGEKIILEAITKKREEAEIAFAARELKCDVDEEESNKKIKKQSEIYDQKEKLILALDVRIGEKTKDVNDLLEKESYETRIHKEAVSKREKELKDLDTAIEGERATLSAITTAIPERQKDKDKIDADILIATNNLSQIKKDTEKLEEENLNKKKELDAEAIRLTNVKADIRILSVRFHNKWRNVMTDTQKKQTTV